MVFKLKNFTVEAFNRDVNRSGDLLHKYEAWSGYRAHVSAMIDRAFEHNTTINSALVTAAGSLNDIELRFLCGRVQSLTLSDADTAAVEQGIARQGLSEAERGKISVIQADYTGANEARFFEGLETLAQNSVSAEAIAEHIATALIALANAPVPAFPKPYQLVVSCPVYTQLLYTQIEVFLKLLFEAGLYTYDELNTILNAAYGAMPGVLRRYNSMLLNACAPGGLLVLLSDMIELDTGSEAYRAAISAVQNGQLNVRDAAVLIQNYGLELSVIGREDFLSKAEVLDEEYLLWPFDKTKAYLVSACLANKRVEHTKP